MEKSAPYPRPNKLIVFGAAGALALGLAGCASGAESGPTDTSTEPVHTEETQTDLRPTDEITPTYYTDGSRYTEIVSLDGVGLLPVMTFDYCEAKDMVTIEGWRDNPTTTDRFVGHPACEDGVLTPEDFAAPTATPSPTN